MRGSVISTAAFAGIIFVLLACSARVGLGELANSPWPKFRCDTRNTGQSPYLGAQDNRISWTVTLSGYLWASPVIGSDGTTYVGSFDNKLYAVDRFGNLKWVYKTNGEIRSSAAIDSQGTIYFGSYDDNLYALNPDGSLKWYYAASAEITSSPAIDSKCIIYFGSDNKLYALNPNGTLRWSYIASYGGIYGSPAIGSDGTIYFGGGYTELYALYDNGTLKWVYTTAASTQLSPAISSDGTIYFGCGDYNLYALSPDGTLKWTYKTGHVISGSPAVASDGTIYVGSRDDKMYAINPNGTLNWAYGTGDDINSSPAIGLDGTIYFGSHDKKFYALNPDGTLKWSYQASWYVDSSPAIALDGTVYVCQITYPSLLYAFGKKPSVLTISPSNFNLLAGESITLTAELTSGGTYLANKLITWNATAGTTVPLSDRTDSLGRVTVTYTAPTYPEAATITASFASDNEYGTWSANSSSTIFGAPGFPIVWVIAAIVIVAAAIGVAILLKKRR